MGRSDTYRQPAAPDPVLPAALVLSLAGPHLPPGRPAHRVLEVDESGGEARAYLLDGGVVVKTQRPPRLRPRTSLAKEAALLAALARPLAGRVPELFGYDQVETSSGRVEFIVMSALAGRAVAAWSPARRPGPDVLRELATVLRAVHAVDVAALRVAVPLPEDHDAVGLRRRLELRFADLVEALDGEPGCWPLPIPAARVAARAVDALPPEMVQLPVVLHSNPGPTHVFTDASGDFTGLIDFGDAYASHPALDLRSWPDPHDRIALREWYLDGGPAPAEWDAVWAVAMVYADMAALTGGFAEAAATDLRLRLDAL